VLVLLVELAPEDPASVPVVLSVAVGSQ